MERSLPVYHGFVPMLRLLLKPVLLLTLLCALFIVAARVLGSTQPPNPALRGFGENCATKPQPCWYGIVPEKTEIPDIEALLNQSSYVQSYNPQSLEAIGTNCSRLWFNLGLYDAWARRINNTPIGLVFSDCHALTLGDFVSVLGAPQLITPATGGLYIIYTEPYVLITVQPKNARAWLRPETAAIGFHIGQPHYIPPAYVTYRWRGFASFKNYQMWQPSVGGHWPVNG